MEKRSVKLAGELKNELLSHDAALRASLADKDKRIARLEKIETAAKELSLRGEFIKRAIPNLSTLHDRIDNLKTALEAKE